MSKKFDNVTGVNFENIVPVEYAVDAGAAATISAGMIVTFTSGGRYVLEGTNGLTSAADVCGIAAGPSDETASVDGVVLVYRAPALLAHAVATTPANLADTVKNDLVTLDVSGTDHTVDENDITNGFIRVRSYDNTTDGNLVVEVPCRYVLWT